MPMAEQRLVGEQRVTAQRQDGLLLFRGHFLWPWTSAAKSLLLFIFESGFFAVAVESLIVFLRCVNDHCEPERRKPQS